MAKLACSQALLELQFRPFQVHVPVSHLVSHTDSHEKVSRAHRMSHLAGSRAGSFSS